MYFQAKFNLKEKKQFDYKMICDKKLIIIKIDKTLKVSFFIFENKIRV